MKKLATTFGLLALMLIVTSFTTPEIGGKNTPGDLGGNDKPTTGTGGGISEIGGKNTPGDLGGNDKPTTGSGIGTFEIGGKSTGGNL